MKIPTKRQYKQAVALTGQDLRHLRHFIFLFKLLQVEGWLKSKRQYILPFCHNDSLIKIGQKDRNPNIVMFKSDSLWNSQLQISAFFSIF